MEKIFIIEHLEPELYAWCMIEYKHISKIAGKENVWFTNIKSNYKDKLNKYGKVYPQSIKSMKPNDSCILDPESSVQLTPKNSKPFKYFIFGGILGDYPPRNRTKDELSSFMKNVKRFNIGKKQMSTDNAVCTVKQIINGKFLRELKFQDNVEIKINSVMSTSLPYRYNLSNGKPLISKELIKFIKKRDKL